MLPETISMSLQKETNKHVYGFTNEKKNLLKRPVSKEKMLFALNYFNQSLHVIKFVVLNSVKNRFIKLVKTLCVTEGLKKVVK